MKKAMAVVVALAVVGVGILVGFSYSDHGE